MGSKSWLRATCPARDRPKASSQIKEQEGPRDRALLFRLSSGPLHRQCLDLDKGPPAFLNYGITRQTLQLHRNTFFQCPSAHRGPAATLFPRSAGRERRISCPSLHVPHVVMGPTESTSPISVSRNSLATASATSSSCGHRQPNQPAHCPGGAGCRVRGPTESGPAPLLDSRPREQDPPKAPGGTRSTRHGPPRPC